jgi:MoaA/NifB/PqqE/SkfB family radical SAM enzyme
LRELVARGTPTEVTTSCHAPFSTLYFDTRGSVRPCCRNLTFPLGHVSTASLRAIWDGLETARLRSALREGDLSLGCEWCSVHGEQGDTEHVYAREFDRYAPSIAQPAWPRRMEFSLSNTCNLECQMCLGELSSRIRARREKLPPLPQHYGESFFEELVEFLPHLETAGFAGGEPFLAREPLRVFDLLIDHAPHVRCNVATNGTIWNDRVERVLDSLLVDVAVSMDGGNADTFESIRTGASFDEVLTNLDRFVETARRRGTTVEIHHCLMPQNVDCFHEILQLAEDRAITVMVNAVRDPKSFSLDYLEPEALRAASDSLNRQRDEWSERLVRNGAVLAHEAERLERRLRHVAQGESFPELFDTIEHEYLGLPLRGHGAADPEHGRERLLQAWGQQPYRLVIDLEENLVEIDERTAHLLGREANELIGRPGLEVIPLAAQRFGAISGQETTMATTDFVEQEITCDQGRLRVLMSVERDDEGMATRGVVWFTGLIDR